MADIQLNSNYYDRDEKLFTSRIDGNQYSINELNALGNQNSFSTLQSDFLFDNKSEAFTGRSLEWINDLPFEHKNTTSDNLNKELIFMVLYLNTYNYSNAKAKQYLSDVNSRLQSMAIEITNTTNYLFKIFIMAVQNQETKFECVFPKVIGDDLPINIAALENIIDNEYNIKL